MTMMSIIFCLGFRFPFSIAETHSQEKQLTGRNGFILASFQWTKGGQNITLVGMFNREAALLMAARKQWDSRRTRDKLYSLKAPPSDLLPSIKPYAFISIASDNNVESRVHLWSQRLHNLITYPKPHLGTG